MRTRTSVAAYYSVCDGVAVHPHLGIHVDQVPAEGFALEPLPQGLPVGDVADVDPRVLDSSNKDVITHTDKHRAKHSNSHMV